MALLFMDTCDHIIATRKWNRAVVLEGYYKRPGRTGYAMLGWYQTYTWRVTPVPRPTITYGAAVKLDTAMTNFYMGISNDRCFQTSDYFARIELHATEEGRLYAVFRSHGITSTSTNNSFPVLTAGEWYYVELKARIYSQVALNKETPYCDIEVRVNEEPVLQVEGMTGWTVDAGKLWIPGENGWAAIEFGSSWFLDDIYVTDGEFLGDVRIYRIRPNGPGDEMQWNVYGASSGWEAVRNEDFEWGNTLNDSYVRAYSSDIGKSFLVNMEDVNPLGPIRGVQANFVNCKTEAGTAAFIPRYKISGSYYDSPRKIYPSWGSWYDRVEPFRKNPVTGQDWTIEDVNTMQVGAKRVL